MSSPMIVTSFVIEPRALWDSEVPPHGTMDKAERNRLESIFLMSTQPWGGGFLKTIIVFHFLHSSLAGTFHLSVKVEVKSILWLPLGPSYRDMSQIYKFSCNHKLPQKTCVISGVLFFSDPQRTGYLNIYCYKVIAVSKWL